MKLKVFILVLSSLIYFSLSSEVYAARPRFRKDHSGPTIASTSQGARCTVRFRPDRLGLQFTCVTPDNFGSGSYELIYDTNGVTQGAGGTILANNPQTYELLFGTCSGAVCNFHENISNARLSIITTLNNGTKILKPYRIKV